MRIGHSPRSVLTRWIFAVSKLIAAACFSFQSTASEAPSFDHGPVFTFIEENDLVVDTDRHYTQGIKLTYLHSDNHLPGCLSNLSQAIPAFGFSVQATRIGTQIGQSIFT